MVRLSGLWKHEFENGDIVLSGTLGNGLLKVIPNKDKTSPNEPDYILYLKERISEGEQHK